MGSSLSTLFFGRNATFGFWTVVIAHVMFQVSFVALTVRARIRGFDWTLEQAAQDLGATPHADVLEDHLPADPAGHPRRRAAGVRAVHRRLHHHVLQRRLADHVPDPDLRRLTREDPAADQRAGHDDPAREHRPHGGRLGRGAGASGATADEVSGAEETSGCEHATRKAAPPSRGAEGRRRLLQPDPGIRARASCWPRSASRRWPRRAAASLRRTGASTARSRDAGHRHTAAIVRRSSQPGAGRPGVLRRRRSRRRGRHHHAGDRRRTAGASVEDFAGPRRSTRSTTSVRPPGRRGRTRRSTTGARDASPASRRSGTWSPGSPTWRPC